MIEIVFVGCFVLGLVYAIISTIFSGIFGGGHEGGHEAGFDVGHDIAGDVDSTGGADSGTIHFSPLSPVIIAMFVTAFGGMGMICLKFFKLSVYASLPIAVLAGILIAGATFFLFAALFKVTQGSSESRQSDMVGMEAEVITTIPSEGLGEVAYVSKETRYTASARSAYKTEIKAHSVVTIEKIVGNTFFVKSAENSKTL
jgi:membrane protein implicated in regulation of membrane protease activity